jgi:large repetitive protein
VTFQCKIDQGDWGACAAAYTTPTLSNGSHTLSVRATDAAGNVDATPATFTWVIAAPGGLDAGALDAGAPDSASVLRDAAVLLDGGALPDSGSVLDSGPREASAPMDVARTDASDSAPEASTAGPDPSPDTASAVPDASPDAAEPGNPDTAAAGNEDAAATGNEDAASVGKKDAAATEVPNKLRGGGFCAIASTRTTPSLGWLFLAFVGLALLRSRRR